MTDRLLPDEFRTEPESAALKKPAFGAPCNGCGLCCKNSVCDLGQPIFGRLKGPCPALERDANAPGYRCGLMVNPARYAPLRAKRYGARRLGEAARLLLASGFGCDARFLDEARDPAHDGREPAWRKDKAQHRAAAAMWGYHIQTPEQLRATLARVISAEKRVGAKALVEGLSIEERLTLREEQLSRRAYAELLRNKLAAMAPRP